MRAFFHCAKGQFAPTNSRCIKNQPATWVGSRQTGTRILSVTGEPGPFLCWAGALALLDVSTKGQFAPTNSRSIKNQPANWVSYSQSSNGYLQSALPGVPEIPVAD